MVNVYKIEYEIGSDMVQWTAYVAGYSPEECVDHLRKYVKGPVVVRGIGRECRVDAISDNLKSGISGIGATDQKKSIDVPTQTLVEKKKPGRKAGSKNKPKE